MVASAEIVRRHGPAYRAKFGDRMLPSHLRAMPDIERCRPETLGGHVSHWETCRESHSSYPSWKTRPCPQCQQDQAEHWLEHPTTLLLPVPYCLVTFTLPADLSGLARRHQTTLDNLLFRSSAEA